MYQCLGVNEVVLKPVIYRSNTKTRLTSKFHVILFDPKGGCFSFDFDVQMSSILMNDGEEASMQKAVLYPYSSDSHRA